MQEYKYKSEGWSLTQHTVGLFLLRCGSFLLNMSAVTESVTQALLKIAKSSNTCSHVERIFFPPSNEKKMSLGKPDAQVEQTQRIIDQRSSICSWNWAREFSARPHYSWSFLWTNSVFLSFKWKWDRDLYRLGLKVPIGAWSTFVLTLSVLQVYCANLSFNRTELV